MKIFIPTPLRSYTKSSITDAKGNTINEMLVDLDNQFPGIRFRVINEQEEIREHMRIFVNKEAIFDINTPIQEIDDIQILQALSGG